MDMELPDIVRVLGVLADPARLVVMGHLAAAAPNGSTLAEIRERTGFDDRRAHRSLGLLMACGLVIKDAGGALHADVGPVREAASAVLALTPIGRIQGDYPGLAGCLANGTIVQVPVDPRLRRELAEMVLRALALTAPIPEQQLNVLLAPLGGDPANLRRLLIDENLLDRDPHTSVYSVVD